MVSVFEILNEKIYGNLVSCFHRTSSLRNIQEISKNGFLPQFGDRLGYGFYGCIDLESQKTRNMEKYGSYLVKFVVDSSGFINFEKDTPDIILTKLENANVKVTGKIITLLNSKTHFTDTKVYELSKIKGFTAEIPGVICTSIDDGYIIIAYRLDRVKVISYSRDEGETWIKLFNKDNLKSATATDILKKYEDMVTVDYNTIKQISRDFIKRYPDWYEQICKYAITRSKGKALESIPKEYRTIALCNLVFDISSGKITCAKVN